MRKTILSLLVMLLAVSVSLQAQTKERPWGLGVNASFVDFQGPITKDYFDFNQTRAVGDIFLARYLSPSFDVKVDLSAGNVNFPITDDEGNAISGLFQEETFLDMGLILDYKLDNGYIFKEEAVFAPYLFTGIGANKIGDEVESYFPMGLGFNIRPTDVVGIRIQSAYKISLEDHFDYTQTNLGVVFNLGKQDAGDADDMGKEVAIIIDSDGDGVPDKTDECPFAAGDATMNGCPDSDNDGVADARDACPFIKGDADNKGCPKDDRDGDMVADHIDECPDVPGKPVTLGCPDQDNDGIADKKDDCPTLAGIAANNGCPEEPDMNQNNNNGGKEWTSVKDGVWSLYYTTSGSGLEGGHKQTLDEVVAKLKANPNYKLKIEGYTDTDGGENANMNLSINRGMKVYEYLESQGINTSRLSVYGFGEYNNKYTNATADGKAKNRRVDLVLVK